MKEMWSRLKNDNKSSGRSGYPKQVYFFWPYGPENENPKIWKCVLEESRKYNFAAIRLFKDHFWPKSFSFRDSQKTYFFSRDHSLSTYAESPLARWPTVVPWSKRRTDNAGPPRLTDPRCNFLHKRVWELR